MCKILGENQSRMETSLKWQGFFNQSPSLLSYSQGTRMIADLLDIQMTFKNMNKVQINRGKNENILYNFFVFGTSVLQW